MALKIHHLRQFNNCDYFIFILLKFTSQKFSEKYQNVYINRKILRKSNMGCFD